MIIIAKTLFFLFKLNIPKNYDLSLAIQIKTGKQTPLTGLRLEYRAQDQANGIAVEGISVSITEPIDIAADSTAYLRPVFKADQTAAESGQIRLRVISNDNLADSLGFVSVNYTLSAAEPSLFIGTPGYIETGVGLEQSITEQLTISNKGLAELNNVQLSLTQSDGSSAAPNWLYIASANSLANMAVGSNETINVTANPGNSVAEADYEFRLKISSNELADIFIPIYVAVTQSGIGNAFFHAADIYTATLDQYGSPIPGLTSARIKLQNEQVLTQEYSATTDANGEALFADIPAGRYIFRASAADHQDVSGRIYIKPGITVAEEIFLMNQIITVEFSVTEITLEDRYEILLQATYETSVPVAVVVSEPASVNLPVMKKGEIFLGEIRVTNYGLIRAYDIASQIPTNSPLINFEFLHQPPEAIEAGEVIILPYRIIALNDFNPETAGDGTGGGSCGFQFAACLDNSCRCVNGYIVKGTACTAFDSNWGGCETGTGTVATTVTPISYIQKTLSNLVGLGGNVTSKEQTVDNTQSTCTAAGGDDGCNGAN